MKKYNLLIPMAGLGSRFKKEGYEVPKQFIYVKDKQLIDLSVECIDTSECNLIFVVRDEQIYNYSADKVLKNKFETLLQNNDTEYLNKIFSSNQDEASKAIKDKFFEKRKLRISILSDIGNNDLEKKIFLQIIDLNWKNHIQYLEQLRQVIGLRSYGQRDPLVEYKKESFSLFENLLEKIRQDIIFLLLNIKIVNQTKQK